MDTETKNAVDAVRIDPCPANPPRLLNRVRQAIRVRHYSRRTEEAYVTWHPRTCLTQRLSHIFDEESIPGRWLATANAANHYLHVLGLFAVGACLS
jgi:hypothetical protein